MAKTAAEKFEMVQQALAQGKTVYFCTMTHVTKIDAKVAAKFAAVGREVVRLKNGALQIAEGRRMVNADYCAIRIA